MQDDDMPEHDPEFEAEFYKDDPGYQADSDEMLSEDGGKPDSGGKQGKAQSTEAVSTPPADVPAANSANSDQAPMQAQMQAQMNTQAQRLAELEAHLQARQRELDAREAAMAQSNTAETQSTQLGASTTPAAGSSTPDNPLQQLIEEFGADFVDLLSRAITQECERICADKVNHGMGTVGARVDQLIEQLSNERQQSHFKTIAAAHSDFMDVVASPEFAAWKSSQPAATQTAIARTIEAGSAEDIIAMLTRFKQSRNNSVDDDALHAAEGVRSSGIRLPKAPTAEDDFAAAWNAA